MKKRILLLVQRPSDYVEMKRASIFLMQAGYSCIIFVHSVCDEHNKEIFLDLNTPDLKKKICDKVIILSSKRNIIDFKTKKIFSCFGLAKKNNFYEQKDNHYKENMPENERSVKKNYYVKNIVRKFIPRFLVKSIKSAIEIMHVIKNKLFLVCLQLKYVPIIREFALFFYIFNLYLFTYYHFKRLIKKNSVNLIILPEDIVGLTTPLLVKAGHSYNVPSLIIPYTICNQEEAFQSLRNNTNFFSNASWLNKIVSILFRSWVMKKDNISLVRLPGAYALSQIIMRTSPKDPWMMNSGNADLIAVENSRMYDYYIQAKIPRNKLKVIGAFYDDTLFHYAQSKEETKEKIFNSYNIISDKPILLIGGCPNQVISNPPGFDFIEMFDMVDYISDQLNVFRDSHHIFIRPHPNFSELGNLFLKKDINVIEEDTASLIAISDLYISFASATIRWAISCGVPTINYDVFYYDYSDYKEVKGVLNVKTKDEFKQAINFISIEKNFQEVKKALEEEKYKWGRLDGKSGERICDTIEKLCKKRRSKVSQLSQVSKVL